MGVLNLTNINKLVGHHLVKQQLERTRPPGNSIRGLLKSPKREVTIHPLNPLKGHVNSLTIPKRSRIESPGDFLVTGWYNIWQIHYIPLRGGLHIGVSQDVSQIHLSHVSLQHEF